MHQYLVTGCMCKPPLIYRGQYGVMLIIGYITCTPQYFYKNWRCCRIPREYLEVIAWHRSQVACQRDIYSQSWQMYHFKILGSLKVSRLDVNMLVSISANYLVKF